MTTPGLEQLADSLRARLAGNISQAIGQYADRLALLIQTNPQGAILPLLDRPDLTQSLTDVLAYAEQQASAAVRQAWVAHGGDIGSPVYASLQSDVTRAYEQAPGLIRNAAGNAWHSVPQRVFEVGVSTPGTNPAQETAVERAQAVREALAGQAAALALRNGLSVSVAAGESRTQAFLDQAAGRQARTGERLGKRWVASMDGRDPRSCPWCKALHGTVVPLGEEFPHGSPVPGTKVAEIHPPAVYGGRLVGPPRHPHCRCRLETVVLGEAAPEPPPEQPAPEPGALPPASETPVAEPAGLPEGFISSADIAAMPEERYQQVHHFLAAALHELAQFLKALLGIGGQRAA